MASFHHHYHHWVYHPPTLTSPLYVPSPYGPTRTTHKRSIQFSLTKDADLDPQRYTTLDPIEEYT